MNTIREPRERKPRSKATYRWWRRNNAVEWIGVKPDRVEEYQTKNKKQVRDKNPEAAEKSEDGV